jgi:hypothetical protein
MSDSEEWKFRPFRCVPKLIRLVFRGQLSIWDIDGDLAAGEVASARPARAIIRSHLLLAGFMPRWAGSGDRDLLHVDIGIAETILLLIVMLAMLRLKNGLPAA